MGKDKVGVNEQLEKYKCFLEQMRHDGESLWRFFGVFLLPQTIFLAFLLRSFGAETFIVWDLGIFVAAIAGSALCLFWMAVCLRCVAYYHFSVALAREMEPKNWALMKGRRQNFRDGRSVKIEGRCYPIKWYQKIIKVRTGLYFVIGVFLTVYIIIIILRGPWWAPWWSLMWSIVIMII